jgi:hypothetical protein
MKEQKCLVKQKLYERESEKKKWRFQIECPLSPGLLWLTQNLALFFLCLSRNNILFNFTYPVRCFRIPPGIIVAQVIDH